MIERCRDPFSLALLSSRGSYCRSMLNVGIARRSSCGKEHFLGRKTKFPTVERKSSSLGTKKFQEGSCLWNSYVAENQCGTRTLFVSKIILRAPEAGSLCWHVINGISRDSIRFYLRRSCSPRGNSQISTWLSHDNLDYL